MTDNRYIHPERQDPCEPEVGGAGVPFEPVEVPSEPMNWEDDGRTVTVGVAGVWKATALTDTKAGDKVTVKVTEDGLAEVQQFVNMRHPLKDLASETLANPNKLIVTFGGVDNREAVASVTAEELAAELLKRVDLSWSPNNEHSANTAKRFVASLRELCNHDMDWTFTTFEVEDSDEMVTMGPIPFYTLCAHHVIPFYGNAWIGYVPENKLCGLSKLARAVRYCAKGMWVQEELTTSIHNFVSSHLEPKGLMVVLRAEHMCMSMRGVQVSGAITTTAKVSGVFADHDRTAKAEFLHWMEMNK